MARHYSSPFSKAWVGTEQNLHQACYGLLDSAPQCSIHSGLWLRQKALLFTLIILLGAAISFKFITINSFLLFFTLIVIAQSVFRIFASITRMLQTSETKVSRVSPAQLPKFTILIPLYKEERVVKRSVRAMERLNYPNHLLEVIYLTEEDDIETNRALCPLISRSNFKIICVPNQAPKTKPKALNFGLRYANGDIITIYDAEDIPHPDQLLHVASKYEESGPSLSVVQAPLHAYNGKESWIASQFELEYAIHFDVWLPAMTKLGWPIPLGGTSNHFKKSILESVGGWDPFNVTEDADLGYRLALNGYTAEMIKLPTQEEAPIQISQWIPQRTRWIKGHLQTLIVLSRFPIKTIRTLGLFNCVGIFLTFISALFSAGLHAAILTALLISPFTSTIDITPLHIGLISLSYLSIVIAALASSAAKRSLPALITMPLYWPLMSIAFILAIWELKTRPFVWAKTQHGLSTTKIDLLHPE